MELLNTIRMFEKVERILNVPLLSNSCLISFPKKSIHLYWSPLIKMLCEIKFIRSTLNLNSVTENYYTWKGNLWDNAKVYGNMSFWIISYPQNVLVIFLKWKFSNCLVREKIFVELEETNYIRFKKKRRRFRKCKDVT